MNKSLSILLLCVLFTTLGCRRNAGTSAESNAESKDAKAMLQGIWLDDESETVTFRVKGDTIYYPDSTSQPAYFKIVNDTLIMGISSAKYPIVKQAAHIFWFKNQNDDVVKLVKSDDPNDALAFIQEKPKTISLTEVLKKDTVVMYKGERYHCYIAINPTKYKVLRSSYNDDGVEVENIYYDNIIHISVFHGATQLYSCDFKKNMYAKLVPRRFLKQSMLSNMEFQKVDAHGFHFNTTICMPDAASCYMLDTNITLDGKMTMELIEY